MCRLVTATYGNDMAPLQCGGLLAINVGTRLQPQNVGVREPSNYNRANDVAVCVWQPTPKTADVTKIAGYVRRCILMNW